ncbi:Phosphatidic acid phosphatase [Phytophthora palmivora]|uniref:Phosphatidic acid phosphatase n=1 Tax=Phytophthora palmivora TaxID=4796 RepID=A0A2P4Y4B0_9STRA|nr:Phosphatidic acid phosphatase [Phytophthora palmivora]
MAPSPSSSLSAFEHSTTQGGGDSKYDTTVEIPNVGDEVAPRCSWKQFMRDYRMVEFGCTAIIYALAGVFAAIEVIERPIPGIRVRLNSTAEVWSLDPAIGEKKLTQEVPMWLLMLLGIGLPVGTNLVVNYALPRFCAVRIIDHDIRDFLLSLFQSIALATFLTQFTKNMTGRFRPCFYDMCGWNHDIIWDGVTNLCTSTSGEKEGRKSFPSGHASFSWSTMLVLTLYLLGRSRLNCTNRCNSMLRSGKKSVMMFLCCVPLLLAAWICITRSIDNWHHYSDILAGSVVGAASAIFAFSNNYGPIFSWRYAGLPIETIHDRIKVSLAL